MKKFQNIYGVIEKFFFIIAAVVIIAYASGYKYDYTKKELVQTGVLELNNIEDNADISFNGNVYQNKNNLTVSFLDQRA